LILPRRRESQNKERPLVSIITPVLNRVGIVGGCLDSVAAQTYPAIEHIVVDGGSTDGTLELLARHRPPHEFSFISEPDTGMYDAINKGISLARGDVLAYLNSDDLYLPWSIDVAVRALAPARELIYGDLGVFHVGSNGHAATFSVQFYPDFSLRYYSFVAALGQPTVFWRRSLTERIGLFDTKYELIGDCEYWLRAALHGAKPRHVPEVMAVQVEHESTLRATQATKLRQEFETLRRSMAAVVDPPSHPMWERVRKSLVWRVRQVEFFYAMKTDDPHKWRNFVETLRAHGVNLRSRDLRLLAPARWRGDASLFGEALRVHDFFREAVRP
jgi:glycosyltransferase involved in cell wall biosynthesis